MGELGKLINEQRCAGEGRCGESGAVWQHKVWEMGEGGVGLGLFVS